MDFGPNLANVGGITDVLGGVRWTSADLLQAALRAADIVTGLVGEEQPNVVIAHGGTPAFFADLFGVWLAGGCAVCVAPDLTPGEVAHVSDFLSANAILVAEDGPNLDLADRYPLVCTNGRPGGRAGMRPAARPSGLDDPALVLFTSGTTGTPKGVVHSFRSLLARTALNRAHIGTEALKRTLCVLPTHFGHGLIGNCLTPLLSGNELFLYPDTGVKSVSRISDVLVEHRISFMSSVPAYWRLALRVAPPPNADVLQRVHIGSAPLSASLWREVIDWTGTSDVVNMYGITETANWVAGASARVYEPADGMVGHAWGGAMAVRGEDGVARPAGEGEILLQTPSMMTGYYGRRDLTRQVLRDGWYRTGDVGTLSEDGVLRLTGRNKTEINKAGMKVHPEEIDALLEGHPAVVEACAFGVPDEISGEIIGVAIVGGIDGGTLRPRDLRDWCRARIKPQSIPDKWFFLSGIPKSERGKADRVAVREHCLGG
ncbi:MAG: acyl--CoA ligase [Alphaproteobacteria bacterium]|nr:acyl--CoA ligase [Alphaproteobacteria bacterium]